MDIEKNAPVPFWFWNGDQQEPEITRQLDLAKAGGWRGLAVHARVGNRTPYVSDRWMELFRHTCIEAKKRGLEIWLYDEEGFPSGTVGGRLPARGEKFQEKYLVWHQVSPAEAASIPDVIASFPVSETEVLVFQRCIGDQFTDMLNPEAAEAFLEMTHKKYVDCAGEFFGSTVTTVYTDDIGYHCGCWGAERTLPWSDTFAADFEQINGYSILNNLSALILDQPDSGKIRRDYRETLSKILNENFVRAMRKWANRHNMLFTGHLCGDEGPFSFMVKHFGDLSRFYMEEDIPGIDDYLTGNSTNRYMSQPRNDYSRLVNKVRGFPIAVLAKQASSIAAQFKQGKCSSEVLTSLGWGVPVKNQMAQIFFELALGVNVIVHHACSYTTESLTKRDHPASYFFQQPYFCCNKEIYAPLNRSLALFSEGRIDADTLVIHPLNAVFAKDNGKRLEEPEWESLQALTLRLLRAHVSFDYGYEQLIAEYGKIEHNTLRIGDGCYKKVLLTVPMDELAEPVRKILLDFAAAGGIVTDHEADLEDCCSHILDGTLDPEVVIAKRLTKGQNDYYLVNYSRTTQIITLRAPAEFAVFEPVSGKILNLNGGDTFALPPLKSCHILPRSIAEKVGAETIDAARSIFRTALSMERAVKIPVGNWKIKREQQNVLVIDCGINNGEKFIFDWQPALDQEKPVICKFNTQNGAKPEFLYVEKNGLYDLTLNGLPVADECGIPHPATQALTGYRIADLVQDGENTISFRIKTHRAEYLYLTGNFAVKDCHTIIPAQKPDFGNLAEQGLPFYWGGVTYETEFTLDELPSLLSLNLTDAAGTVKVEINGQDAGVLYGAPWNFDLTNFIKTDTNHLKLTSYNTAQNFFGYHRAYMLMLHFTAWHPKGTEQLRDEDFALAPHGIYAKPKLTGEYNG